MSKISLKGKVIIVTGGGRGLGRAMALGFARAGALGVTVTSSPRSPAEARAVAREIEDILGPGRGLAVTADVGDWTACKRTVAATIRKWGALHILVNNAGRAARVAGNERQPFWQARPAGWENVIATNVNGPFFMAKAALPYLTAHKRARIINVSKTRGAMFGPRSAPYGPSKAALEAMTLAFAQDLADTGVTVNSLAPGGSSDTKLGSAAMKRENLKVKTLLPPEIMVAPALWLASHLSDGVTGCRFVAKDWNDTLPPEQAAEGAREAAAFLPPTGKGTLERTWKVRGKGK